MCPIHLKMVRCPEGALQWRGDRMGCLGLYLHSVGSLARATECIQEAGGDSQEQEGFTGEVCNLSQGSGWQFPSLGAVLLTAAGVPQPSAASPRASTKPTPQWVTDIQPHQTSVFQAVVALKVVISFSFTWGQDACSCAVYQS